MKKTMDLKTERAKLRKMVRLANSIMEYCGGDAWEREVTQKDREKFADLYEEVFGISSLV